MIQMTEKEFLAREKWYHATEDIYFERILREGINASVNRSVPSDFGYGFYLCPNQEWSEKYCKIFTHGVILEFNFRPIDILKGSQNYRFFEYLNEEFADFVFANRKDYAKHENSCVHDYLLVGGVMSDGQQAVDFADYDSGKIDKQELYRRLLEPKEDWQLLIHSQDLCDAISPCDAFDLGGRHYDIKNYTPFKGTSCFV